MCSRQDVYQPGGDSIPRDLSCLGAIFLKRSIYSLILVLKFQYMTHWLLNLVDTIHAYLIRFIPSIYNVDI